MGEFGSSEERGVDVTFAFAEYIVRNRTHPFKC